MASKKKPARKSRRDTGPVNEGKLLPEGFVSPFAPFLHLHEEAVREAQRTPEAEIRKQWERNKQSSKSPSSETKPIKIVCRITGRVIEL
jgi:hypothetical protein